MNINATSINFGIKAPKISPKNIKVKEEPLPDFFRDSELFDPNKDSITRGYITYDHNDLPIGTKKPFGRHNSELPSWGKIYPDEIPYAEVVERYEEGMWNETDEIPGLLDIVR